MSASRSKTQNICLQCRHHYITWVQSFPYGCRAMGFRSKHAPYLDVLDASGVECLRFQLKPHLAARTDE
ncbi:MAG: uracil-DNA glycosylase [Gammaproteobacteria bacterium]|nr:uracil-DNA glycosylase [Gammaproteobacteria bacterium]